MRNLLFVVIGCLSGCVLIVNQTDDAFPVQPDIRVVTTTTQSVSGPDSAPTHTSTVTDTKAPIHTIPLPPALAAVAAVRHCAVFILPTRKLPPKPIDINDAALKSRDDVEDALIAYSRALEQYISEEQARLVNAHRAYLLKCNTTDIKN